MLWWYVWPKLLSYCHNIHSSIGEHSNCSSPPKHQVFSRLVSALISTLRLGNISLLCRFMPVGWAMLYVEKCPEMISRGPVCCLSHCYTTARNNCPWWLERRNWYLWILWELNFMSETGLRSFHGTLTHICVRCHLNRESTLQPFPESI